MGSPEQQGLSEEEVNSIKDRAEKTMVSDDLVNKGRLKNPYDPEFAHGNESTYKPEARMVEEDQARFDALEAAKKGDLSLITDPIEKSSLTQRYQEEGQKGLESLVESLQKKVTQGPLDAEKLGTHVAETRLGYDARDTEKMNQGIQAAAESIEKVQGND